MKISIEQTLEVTFPKIIIVQPSGALFLMLDLSSGMWLTGQNKWDFVSEMNFDCIDYSNFEGSVTLSNDYRDKI